MWRVHLLQLRSSHLGIPCSLVTILCHRDLKFEGKSWSLEIRDDIQDSHLVGTLCVIHPPLSVALKEWHSQGPAPVRGKRGQRGPGDQQVRLLRAELSEATAWLKEMGRNIRRSAGLWMARPASHPCGLPDPLPAASKQWRLRSHSREQGSADHWPVQKTQPQTSPQTQYCDLSLWPTAAMRE